MGVVQNAAYAGLRRGLRQPGVAAKKKKKGKPRQLSAAELASIRRALAKQRASEALY